MSASSGRQASMKGAWRWVPGVTCLVFLGLLVVAAASSSRLPRRGGELFGRLIRAVQRHPGITAGVALGSAAAVWLAIGLGAALESWPRGTRPPDDPPDF